MIPAAVRASSDAGPDRRRARRLGRGGQPTAAHRAGSPPDRRTTWVVGTAARAVGTAPHRQRRPRRGRRRIGEQFLHARPRRRRLAVSSSASSAGRSRKPRRSVAGDVDLPPRRRGSHRRRRTAAGAARRARPARAATAAKREVVAAMTAAGRLLEPDVTALRALHGRVRSPPADRPRPAARSSSCCIRPRRTCASAYAPIAGRDPLQGGERIGQRARR